MCTLRAVAADSSSTPDELLNVPGAYDRSTRRTVDNWLTMSVAAPLRTTACES